jgi:hypothetical protein
MRSNIVLALCAAALTVSAAAHAQKTKKPKPACGIKHLPLAEGTSWVYEPVNQPPGGPPPANLRVEVLKVEKDGANTAITIKETYRDNEYEMVATCDKSGIVLPPESFFFAGEPGGTAMLELSNVKHKGSSYPVRGLKSGDQWLEEFKADVKRVIADGAAAEHGDAKVELERLVTVLPGKQVVSTGIQTYKATPVEFEVLGRGLVGEKTQEIPVRDKGAIWFVNKIGVVRAREVSGREWQLIDSTLIAK